MRDFIYGFHAVSALIKKSPDSIAAVYIENTRKDTRMVNLIRLLDLNSVGYQLVPRGELQKRVGDVVHQGVVAGIMSQAKRGNTNLDKILTDLGVDETLLILDGIVDPANFGACLRAADAAGVKTVILPRDKSAPVTAVTRKVAAGAAESINIVTVTNLVRTIETLKKHDFWIFGLADETTDSIYDHHFRGRVAVVMGNEGKGLRRLTRKICDHLVSIPMMGHVESLNVAVATGIALYEINRQRNAPN